MNPLRFVLTFTFTVFFTIGMLANQNIKSNLATNDQVISDETTKVSAAQVVSLFNFFKVETTNTDSTESKNDISESKLKAIYDFFILSRTVYY